MVIKSDRTAALCDFGLATVIEPCGSSSGLTTSDGFKGSVRWCSPELLRGKARSPQSDMWAFGCFAVEVSDSVACPGFRLTTLQVFTGTLPYKNATGDPQVITQVIAGVSPEPDDDDAVPDLLSMVLRGCWDQDPMKRISAGKLCSSMESIHSGLKAQKLLEEANLRQVNSDSGPTSPHQTASVLETSHAGQKHQRSPSQEVVEEYKARSEADGPSSNSDGTGGPQQADPNPDAKHTRILRPGTVSSHATSVTTLAAPKKPSGIVAGTTHTTVTDSSPRGILTPPNPKLGSIALPPTHTEMRPQVPEASSTAGSSRKPSTTISFDWDRAGSSGVGSVPPPTLSNRDRPQPHLGARGASPAPSGRPSMSSKLSSETGHPSFPRSHGHRTPSVTPRSGRGGGERNDEHAAQLAVAEISVGGELYKYEHRMFGKLDRCKRNCRVDPRSKTLYWTSGDFANLGRLGIVKLENGGSF